MRRLSILTVAYPFAPVGARSVGGAEQVLSSIDRFLHEQGHRSVVLACEGSTAYGPLEAVAMPSGDLDEPTRAAARETFRARLHELLRAEPFDLVHMHGVDFASYLPPEDVTTLVTLHLPISFYDTAALRALPRSVHLCCVSAAQRALAPRDLRLLPDVPNGVPLSALAPRADVGDYLLVLSRICPTKGIHHALEVAHELGLPAVIAGRVHPYPEHVRYFEREVKPRLDAERRYVGAVGMPEKAALLARARCLLVPSLVDETSSLVSMEALASGTPVVALARGALPTVIEHGVTGFLAHDVQELAKCVREVSKIDRRRCRERAEERFSERSMCERYVQLYRDLAPSSAAAHAAEPVVELEEITTLTGLRELAPAWRDLFSRCIDATFLQRPEWQLNFAERLLQGDLLTLALRSEGRLIGLVPTFTWRRGEARVLSLLGAGLSDYQTLLFDPAHRERCTARLRDFLESGRVDACEFGELLPDSPLLTMALPRAREERVEPQEVCPALFLDDGPFERHLTYKLRADVHRAQRDAARDGFRLERADEASLPEMIDRRWVLHEQRRDPGEGGLYDVPGRRAFHEAALRSLSDAGILRMYGLRAPTGELVGTIEAVQDGTTLRMYRHGFDPAHSRLSPGALLMAHAMGEAAREGAKVIDFMRGDEPYKYRWGAHDRIRLTRRSFEL